MFFKYNTAKRTALDYMKHPDIVKVIIEWNHTQNLYIVHALEKGARYMGSGSIRKVFEK
mgnify:FL=1